MLAGGCAFHAVAQVGALLFSVFHFRIDQAVAIGILVLAVVVGTLVAGVAAGRKGEETDGRGWVWLLPLGAGVVSYGLLWWSALRLVDYSWDGNTYHIPPVHLWARDGYVHWIDPAFPGSDYINGYPKAAEVLALLLVRAGGSSRLLTTATLCFLPLAWLGLASLARSLGASRAAGWGTGALFLLVPTVVWQSVTTYVDAAFAAAVIGVFAAALRVREEWAEGHPGWGEAAILGAALGLALGLKSSGLLVGLVAAAGLLAPGAPGGKPARRDQRWTGAGLAVTLGVLVGGFWYLRNYLHTGSPIFPAGLTLAGHRIFPGLPVAQVLDVAGNTPPRFRAVPDPFRVFSAWAQGGGGWPETAYGWDARLGGLGFLWIAGGLPGVLFATQWAERKREFWVLGVMAGAAFLLSPMHWWARYTLWIYALGLPCLAVTADHVLRMGPRMALRGWLTLVFVLALLEGGLNLALVADNYTPGDAVAGESAARREHVFAPAPLFPDLQGTPLEPVLRGRESVAVGRLNTESGAQLLMGALCQPIGVREIYPLPAGPIDAASLRARGIRFVILDEAAPPPQFKTPIPFRVEEADQFQLVILANS